MQVVGAYAVAPGRAQAREQARQRRRTVGFVGIKPIPAAGGAGRVSPDPKMDARVRTTTLDLTSSTDVRFGAA